MLKLGLRLWFWLGLGLGLFKDNTEVALLMDSL
jgi:hypothetical protein